MNQSSAFHSKRIALFLGAMLALAFPAVLIGQAVFYYRDFGVIAYPTIAYMRDAFWQGELPLWNPYSNCGAPFLAQWGTMPLYPGSLIYLILPLPWSLHLFCLFHLWLGGMGIYLLARKWTDAPWASAFAAVAFTFNGITLASLSWPNYTAAIGLFPWVVLLVSSVWSNPGGVAAKRRGIAVASLITAAQILTGVPEIILFTWILITVLWIRELWNSRKTASLVRTAIPHVLVMALGAGLVAVQILPFVELLANSQRASGALAERWPLPPWGWANLILPLFHAFETPRGTWFQYGQEFLSSTYLGMGLLGLATIGAASMRDGKRLLLAFISLGAAILALGSAGYLYPFLTSLAPILQVGRYPVKFVFLLMFCVPLLAAYGLKRLEETPSAKARQNAVLATVAVFTILLITLLWFARSYPFPYDQVGVTQRNSIIRWLFAAGIFSAILLALNHSQVTFRNGFAWGALLLLALDGIYHLPNQNPVTKPSIYAPDLWTEANSIQKPIHGNGRVFITPPAEQRLLRTGIKDPVEDMTGKRLALWSHLNLLDRIPKVNGSSTLQVSYQAAVQSNLYSTNFQGLDSWLDFLNVTLITSSKSLIEWDRWETAFPLITGGQAPVLKEITEPIDFGKEVVIDQPHALTNIEPADVTFSTIFISPHEIRFRASASSSSVAVLAQSWYPAWRAEVNGQAVPLLRANHAFQAVPLPMGESEVRVYYHDPKFRIGAAISGVTILLVAGCFFRQKNFVPARK